MNYSITGYLREKGHVQTISNNFHKREFVIEVINERNTDWNEWVKLQLINDKTTELDRFELDTYIEVHFNIRGRKWEKDGKVNYFVNLEAWRIEANTDFIPEQEPQAPPVSSKTEQVDLSTGPDDDLPF